MCGHQYTLDNTFLAEGQSNSLVNIHWHDISILRATDEERRALSKT